VNLAFLDWLLAGTALLSGALVVLVVLRRLPSAWRAAVLACALIAAAIIPTAGHLLPRHTLGVLPSTVAPTLSQTKTEVVMVRTSGAMVSTVVAPQQATSSVVATAHYSQWLWVALLSVSSLLFARKLLGHILLGRILRRSSPSTEVQSLADQLGRCLGGSTRARVFLGNSECRHTAMTWGIARPVIVLPHVAESWPKERLVSVLLHELAHAKRGDWLVLQVSGLAASLLWFNPLAWFALQKLRFEAERAADDLVIEAGVRPADYAQHLIDIARALRRHRQPFAYSGVTIMKNNRLEERVKSILDLKRKRAGMASVSLLVAGTLALATAAPLSMLHLGLNQERAAATTKAAQVKKPAQATGNYGVMISNIDKIDVEKASAQVRELAPNMTDAQFTKIKNMIGNLKKGYEKNAKKHAGKSMKGAQYVVIEVAKSKKPFKGADYQMFVIDGDKDVKIESGKNTFKVKPAGKGQVVFVTTKSAKTVSVSVREKKGK